MIDTEDAVKLDELDRLLNDPDSKMEPARVWALLAEIAKPVEKPASDAPACSRRALLGAHNAPTQRCAPPK